MRAPRLPIALTLTVLWLAASAPAARADGLQELVDDARTTLLNFADDPNMDWFRDNVKQAKGLLIVPRLLKGGFFFGGSGGSGVLLARDPQIGVWSYPAFYTLGSVTFGAQIGGEAAEVVFMIMTEKGLDAMLATSVKLGADVEVAAGPVGVGTKAATVDILAFSRAKGLFAGATVDGAVVAARDGWNQEYYGRPFRPLEILLKRAAMNPKADPLRGAVTKVAGIAPVQPTVTLRPIR